MKRILALLLCSLLLLGAWTVGAVNPQDVFSRSHGFQWTLTLTPDTDVLISLFQRDTPLSDELQGALRRSEDPQATLEAVKTLAEGISDLRFGGSFAPWALALTLGTEQGELSSATLWADAKTGSNGITTDLIDSLFFLPQEKVKPLLDQSNPLLTLNIPGLISPYLSLLRDEADKLLGEEPLEQGNYSIGELGNFDKKASLTITTHEAVRLLKPLLDAFESDFVLQTAISRVANAATLIQGASVPKVSANAEISRSLKNFIAQVLSMEEADLAELSAYSRDGLDSLCYVVDTSRVQEGAAFRLAVLPGEKEGGLILTAGDGYKLEGSGTPQGVDWEKVRMQAMEGFGRPLEESLHLTLQYMAPENEPAALSLWAYSAGSPLFGMTAEHKEQQAEPYIAETTAQLSVFSKKPVLSLSFILQETDKLPALPDTTNWPVLSLIDDDLESKVDAVKLLIPLLRRFSVAFPDTAEDLIKAAQSLDN